MTFKVRRGIETDAEGMARVHFEAVQGTARAFYPPEVIESWAQLPDQPRQEQFRRAISGGEEVFVVAEGDEGIVGFGSLAPGLQELRAVYVDPRVGRRGAGGRILAELERLAADHGIHVLHLDSSLNAEAFYARHGYEVVGRGTHRLSSGSEMACVSMRKDEI
jgi:putative acetyltransferase